MAIPFRRALYARRRRFLIKPLFQLQFSLWPACLLALFLSVAFVHLRLDFPQGFGSVDGRLGAREVQAFWGSETRGIVSIWAGAYFLALAAWVWRKVSGLRSDLEALASWAAGLAAGGSAQGALVLRNPETRRLGQGLQTAASELESWDREIESRSHALARSIEGLRRCEAAEADVKLSAARERLRKLSQALSVFRVDEGLS